MRLGSNFTVLPSSVARYDGSGGVSGADIDESSGTSLAESSCSTNCSGVVTLNGLKSTVRIRLPSDAFNQCNCPSQAPTNKV